MSKAGSASKVKINSFDDLFGASQAPAGTEQVREIPLSELHEFKGHPFKVLDDEKMQETVESIRNYGVLMPGIARPRAGGGYEIIAGHRRKHGCELAGLSTMPMFVRDYSDDEATVIMVDTNIQREDILPSEKARAYAMKYEAMKHQGKKGSGSSLDEVGEAAGESGKTVQRYIWLAEAFAELYGLENILVMDAGRYGFVKLQYYKEPQGFDDVITFTDSQSMFENLWQEWLDTKLYLMAKGTPLMEKGYGGVLKSLPEEKQKELTDRKADFAIKAGITL